MRRYIFAAASLAIALAARAEGPAKADRILVEKAERGLPKGWGWVGRLHRLRDWTRGCIAVTNAEMDEIWQLVEVGTPIEIKP